MPFVRLEGSLMLSGGDEMMEHELPPRRESLVEGESLCTWPLCRIIGQAHVDRLLEIVGDGPSGVVWEQLCRDQSKDSMSILSHSDSVILHSAQNRHTIF